jgi:RimJ/RimL family protein N-acetyltransferase
MAEDLLPMRAWIEDRRVTRNLSGLFVKPQTIEQTREYLGGLLRGDVGGVNLVIAHRETLDYMGQINLLSIDQTARRAELAVVLAPECANKGYGQEAVRLLLAFGFEQLNLHRVFLKVYADNARAIHVYEKLGFQTEGRLRDELFRDGAYRDVLVMGLLAGEGG